MGIGPCSALAVHYASSVRADEVSARASKLHARLRFSGFEAARSWEGGAPAPALELGRGVCASALAARAMFATSSGDGHRGEYWRRQLQYGSSLLEVIASCPVGVYVFQVFAFSHSSVCVEISNSHHM